MAQKIITTKSSADGIGPAIDNVWATVRNATSGILNETFLAARLDGTNYKITRHFYYFDLSITNIPAGSMITGLTLRHPVVSSKTDANSTSTVVTSHTAADPPVSGSYDDITLNSPTSFGSKALADISTSTTTDITLNQSAINDAQSSLGGIWKVLLRNSRDVDNAAPTGLNQYNYTPDNMQLVVDYTPSGGAALFVL